jgi:hypothetical protein
VAARRARIRAHFIHSRRRRVDAAPDVAFFRTIALASAITAP